MITINKHSTRRGKETVTITITDEDVQKTAAAVAEIEALASQINQSQQLTLKEFVDRDFGGNISTFAKAYDISRPTAYNLLLGKTKAQSKLRERLKRKGVTLP